MGAFGFRARDFVPGIGIIEHDERACADLVANVRERGSSIALYEHDLSDVRTLVLAGYNSAVVVGLLALSYSYLK